MSGTRDVAQLATTFPACTNPALQKACAAILAQEVEERGLEIQVYPQTEASPGYMKPCLQNKNKKVPHFLYGLVSPRLKRECAMNNNIYKELNVAPDM